MLIRISGICRALERGDRTRKNPARGLGGPGWLDRKCYFVGIIGGGAGAGAGDGQHDAAKMDVAAAMSRNLAIFMVQLVVGLVASRGFQRNDFHRASRQPR